MSEHVLDLSGGDEAAWLHVARPETMEEELELHNQLALKLQEALESGISLVVLGEHGSHNQKDHGNWAKGRTAARAIDVEGDLALAVKLLGEGKHIKLEQPRQVSTVLDKLAAIVEDAKAKGGKAPDYDLCKVHVPGTNLFCQGSKGIERARMPQLIGKPAPGTPAAKLLNEKGEADLTEGFIGHLKKQGYKLADGEEHASYLRATQNQLLGNKVAGMAKHLASGGSLGDSPLIISKESYILDGHHRWAAHVGHGARDGNLLNDPKMRVKRFNISIGDLLWEAQQYTVRMGLPNRAMGEAVEASEDCGCLEPAPQAELTLEHASHNQKDHGRRGKSAGQLLSEIHKKGGFTYQPKLRTSPKSGWVVAKQGAEETVRATDMTVDHIQSYIDRHRAAFEDSRAHVGAWHNKEDGNIYLDISFVVGSRRDAIRLGRRNRQLAVYHLDSGEEVPVPGGKKARA